jgi:hypothetical protein
MTIKKPKKQNLNTFIKNILRRGSFYWKARTEAMTAARVSRGLYKCKSCEELFGPKEVDLDHDLPVVDPRTGFTTWDDYINRLFCNMEGFSVLCKQCHENKTRIEDALREHHKSEKDIIPNFKHKKKKVEDEEN